MPWSMTPYIVILPVPADDPDAPSAIPGAPGAQPRERNPNHDL